MSARWMALSGFWRQRSRREQAYLAVMLLSLGVFAYWFLLVAPLRSLAADAERRHGIALAAQARLPGVLAELAQLRQAPAAPAETVALVQSAASAGVVVVPDPGSDQGFVMLRFEAASPQALFSWLSALRESQGHRPVRASVRQGASGLDGDLAFGTHSP